MRVFACLPKSVNFQGAVGRTIGLPFLWLLSLGKQRKLLAHLLKKQLRSSGSVVRETMKKE